MVGVLSVPGRSYRSSICLLIPGGVEDRTCRFADSFVGDGRDSVNFIIGLDIGQTSATEIDGTKLLEELLLREF